MPQCYSQEDAGPSEISGSLTVAPGVRVHSSLYLGGILLSRVRLGLTAPSNTLLRDISQEAFAPAVGG